MTDSEWMASFGLGDSAAQASSDPHTALLNAAKAEVDLMMKQIAAQSQAPALFSATLSEACRGQHLADFVKILVEMGGIGPALSEMHGFNLSAAAPASETQLQGLGHPAQAMPFDFQSMQSLQSMHHMQQMQQIQSMQRLTQMPPAEPLHAYTHMPSQFNFPYVSPTCHTPRSREELCFTKPVHLELVGTTLVAKTANEQAKLDVSAVRASRRSLLHRLCPA
jgi:hypothetical protein